MRMKLYGLDGTLIEPPKILYRGFPLNRREEDALTQLDSFFEEGGVKSKVLLIKEGKFNLDKSNLKKYYHFYAPGDIENKYVPKYLKMLDRGHIKPSDIDDELRIQHVVLNLPTPLVSASSEAFFALNYSRFCMNPVLVFKTDNLEGADFRTDERDIDSEIGVFGKLPAENLAQVFYFYEETDKIKKILKAHGRDDVILKKGFVKTGFTYMSLCGNKVFNTPSYWELRRSDEFADFYRKNEEALLCSLADD